MANTRTFLAKLLGTALILLGASNVVVGAAMHAALVPFLGPAVLLGLVGLLAWGWAIRADRAAPREIPNTIWLVVAKIFGTASILYGLGIELLFAAFGRAELALGSLVLFVGLGVVLWAWSLSTQGTIRALTGPSRPWELAPPPPPPVPPSTGWSSPLPPPPPPPGVDLTTVYRDVDREGTAAYALARRLAFRVAYMNAVIAIVIAIFVPSLLLIFGATDLGALLVSPLLVFYFGFSAWALVRKFGWVDQELQAGRIPSEADLDRGLFQGPPTSAPGTGGPGGPVVVGEEPSVVARTLVMLQFGRHMARDARQFAVVLLLFGLVFGSICAWIVTSATLTAFAGGTAYIARDAAAAWGAAGLTAVIVFLLLYPVYTQVDRLDRRYRSLETTIGELERGFWSRF